MANLTSKYLDLSGLNQFWTRAKEYISKEILSIDGTKILLRNSNNDSKSVTDEIESLWQAIGDTGENGGNIAGNVSQILGAYIKSFKGATGDYITIGPTDQTSGPTDLTLTIDESNLNQKIQILDTINDEYINDIEFSEETGGNKYVSITPLEGGEHKALFKIDDSKIETALNQDSKNYAVNGQKFQDATNNNVILISNDIQHTNDSTLSGTTLYEAIETIKSNQVTSISGGEGTYIDISFNKNSNNVTTSVDETKLENKFKAVLDEVSNIKTDQLKSIVGDEDNTYVNISFENAGAGAITTTVNEAGITSKFSNIDDSIKSVNDTLSEYNDKFNTIDQNIESIENKSYVNTIGGASGTIILEDNPNTPGQIKFSMTEQKMSGEVYGLGTAAYETMSPYTESDIKSIFEVEEETEIEI